MLASNHPRIEVGRHSFSHMICTTHFLTTTMGRYNHTSNHALFMQGPAMLTRTSDLGALHQPLSTLVQDPCKSHILA